MQLRRYQPGEETLLWEIFYNTIRNVNTRDYSLEQVKAWAPDKIDENEWAHRIAVMNPFVCVSGAEIVGYAGLHDNGYVDHFYVHHLFQGQGVGTLLMQEIVATAVENGNQELTADVSITAMPFFQSRCFEIVATQEVTLRSVVFKNYKMKRTLTDSQV